MKLSTAFLKSWVEPWREYVSEFVGVALFVFLSSSVIISQSVFGESDLLVTALGIGLSYSCILYATSHVSGGFLNPAVVVSLWLVKRLSSFKTIFFLISQGMGSIAASALVWAVFGERAAISGFGLPVTGLGVTVENALVLEAVLSLILVFLIFAVSIAKTAPSVFGPLVFGLFTAIATIIAQPVSGASINVSRTFGPTIFMGDYANLLVYLAGSLLGSLSGVVYEYVFLRRRVK